MEEKSAFFRWFFWGMIAFVIMLGWLYLFNNIIPRLQKKYSDYQEKIQKGKQQMEQDEQHQKRLLLFFKISSIILIIFSIIIIFCLSEDKFFKPISRLMFWGVL